MLPVFTIHPLDIKIDLSDITIIQLWCEANEALSFKWERQNGIIPPDAKGSNSGKLIIENLSPTHSGKYRCVATNRYGSTFSKYATITIPGE